MRNLMMALGAASLLVPVTMVLPATTTKAEARKRHYTPRVYQRNGRTYCRHSDGTTGLLVGGVGGALVGRSIDTGGDRTLGTVLGAAGGALAGRAVDRSMTANRRCR